MFHALAESSAVAAQRPILYADPIAMALLDDGASPRGVGDLGAFPNQLGVLIPLIGVDSNTLISAYNSIKTLFGGGTPDQGKSVWSKIPLSLTRLSGGHGTWTDGATGEVLTDAGTDVRKGAIMASALGMYNDKRNWWFDDSTGQHVDPGTAYGRWQKLFGNVDFATAYAAYPTLFKVYGADPSIDPVVPDIGGTPLPAHQSIAQTITDALGTKPLVGSPTTRTPGVQQAGIGSMFTNISPTMLLVGAAAIGLFFVMGRKRS